MMGVMFPKYNDLKFYKGFLLLFLFQVLFQDSWAFQLLSAQFSSSKRIFA